MKKYLLALSLSAIASTASAAIAICTPHAGTLTNGGNVVELQGATGSNTPAFDCPSISSATGFSSILVQSGSDYTADPTHPGAVSITLTYTVAGGPLNGQSASQTVLGDNTTGSVSQTPPNLNTFASGSSALTTFAAFNVNLTGVCNSANCPANSSSVVLINYTPNTVTGTPEPTTLGLLGSALLGVGFLARRKK